MTSRRTLVAIGLAAQVLAGCAQTPSQPSPSWPMGVIVNDPAARGPAQSSTMVNAPDHAWQLPEAPLHDEFVPQVTYESLFERIRAGFGIADVDHPWVNAEYDWYSRHPEYLVRVFERGSRYLHYITTEVDRRGIPLEIALLPVVESAFNPFAYSRSRAAGLWQFIAPTATHFELERNWWQDQRRDVIESTRAACDYLLYLHGVFEGDWLLAVAAYNFGSLNVRRAVERNRAAGRPTDFFSLQLPAETRAYVPKLLAISRIVRDPAAAGVELPPIADSPYFRVVPTEGPLDLHLAAELAGLDPDELHALNPAFHRWATDPDGPHRILVPAAVADQMELALVGLTPEQRLRLVEHKVRRGETAASIARRHGLNTAALAQVNGVRAIDVRAGDEIWVPDGGAVPLKAGLYAQVGDPPRRASGGDRTIHVVRSGESLWTIARRHGMSTQQLASLNGLSGEAMLKPGQRLVIRGDGGGDGSATRTAAAADAAAAARPIRYKVQSGDTLFSIARRFEVSVRQLQAWNGLRDSGLRTGQTLTVHVDDRKDFGG